MLIVGDFFDHNRVREPLVMAVGDVLAGAALPVVVLPGNHDPFFEQSIYDRFAQHFPDNVHIVRAADGELLSLPAIGVQIWGQAHTAYADFSPAAARPQWLDGAQPPHWRIAMAHGSYVGADGRPIFGYKIEPEHLRALDAHYIALGHLERYGRVGPDDTTAYYSGSPQLLGGAALVDMTPQGIAVSPVDLPPDVIGDRAVGAPDSFTPIP